MTTIDCPHQEEAARSCAGCTSVDVGADGEPNGRRYCQGEVTGKVYRDSDDGIRRFLAVDLATSCGCNLTEEEEQQAIEQLCEHYSAGLESEQ